jgi:hypothetical protein
MIMSTADDQADIARMTGTLRVLAVAMLVGLLAFLGIASFVRMQQGAMPPGAPRRTSAVLTALAVGLGAAGLVASVTIPGAIANASRRRIARGTWRPPRPAGRSDVAPPDPEPIGDAVKLAYVYQAQWIAGAAINEAPAFFAILAYMLEGNPIALGVALVLVLAMAMRIPSRPRVESWIEQQLQLVAQERQLGGCPGP